MAGRIALNRRDNNSWQFLTWERREATLVLARSPAQLSRGTNESTNEFSQKAIGPGLSIALHRRIDYI